MGRALETASKQQQTKPCVVVWEFLHNLLLFDFFTDMATTAKPISVPVDATHRNKRGDSYGPPKENGEPQGRQGKTRGKAPCGDWGLFKYSSPSDLVSPEQRFQGDDFRKFVGRKLEKKNVANNEAIYKLLGHQPFM